MQYTCTCRLHTNIEHVCSLDQPVYTHLKGIGQQFYIVAKTGDARQFNKGLPTACERWRYRGRERKNSGLELPIYGPWKGLLIDCRLLDKLLVEIYFMLD